MLPRIYIPARKLSCPFVAFSSAATIRRNHFARSTSAFRCEIGCSFRAGLIRSPFGLQLARGPRPFILRPCCTSYIRACNPLARERARAHERERDLYIRPSYRSEFTLFAFIHRYRVREPFFDFFEQNATRISPVV